MIQARIYRPSKTAMQSGKAKSRQWVLEFCVSPAQFIEPIMGWWGSKDTLHQIRLTFPTLETALAYGEKRGIVTQVEEPHLPLTVPKHYADTFRYDRIG